MSMLRYIFNYAQAIDTFLYWHDVKSGLARVAISV